MLACRAAVLMVESLLAWAPKASGFWGILIGAGRELLLLDHAPYIRPTWTTSPTTPVVEADPDAYPQPHTAPHQPCTRPPVGGASTRQSHTHSAAYHPPIYFTPSHCKHLCPVVLTPVVLNKKGSTATNQGQGCIYSIVYRGDVSVRKRSARHNTCCACCFKTRSTRSTCRTQTTHASRAERAARRSRGRLRSRLPARAKRLARVARHYCTRAHFWGAASSQFGYPAYAVVPQGSHWSHG